MSASIQRVSADQAPARAQVLADVWRLIHFVVYRRAVATVRVDVRRSRDADTLLQKLSATAQTLCAVSPVGSPGAGMAAGMANVQSN